MRRAARPVIRTVFADPGPHRDNTQGDLGRVAMEGDATLTPLRTRYRRRSAGCTTRGGVVRRQRRCPAGRDPKFEVRPEVAPPAAAVARSYPDDVPGLIRYVALELTNFCWRNSLLEDWHAGDGPLSDPDMMTEKRTHQRHPAPRSC
jgi:hypothetical protein